MTTPVSASRPGEGNEADHHRDAEVVAQDIEEPDGPHQGEGLRQEHDQDLGDGLGVDVEDEKDDGQGKRDDNQQALSGRFHVFELAAPEIGVARGHLQFFTDERLSLLDIAAHVDIADVHEDQGGLAGILANDHGGALADLEVGHLLHGDLGPGGGRDQHPAQGGQILPVVLKVAQVHRVALQALHGVAEVHAAERREDNVLDVPHGEAVAGRLLPLDVEIQVVAPGGALGEGAGGLGEALEQGFGLGPQACSAPRGRVR